MPAFNYERAARTLVEAVYFGDQKAAERNGVSVRSVWRWRQRMDDDQRLSASVGEKKQEFERGWAEEIPATLRVGALFLRKAFDELDAGNPEHVHAAAGVFKILAEVGITKAVLDVRLASIRGSDGEADNQVDAYSEHHALTTKERDK